jgi:hypothetical protein
MPWQTSREHSCCRNGRNSHRGWSYIEASKGGRSQPVGWVPIYARTQAGVYGSLSSTGAQNRLVMGAPQGHT